MKTHQNNFKIVMLLLFSGFAFASCSKDDDNKVDDNNEDLKGGQATAVIGVDNKTIQFSSNGDNNFATIVRSKLSDNDDGNEINQLVIVLADEKSDIFIVSQVVPAPNSPINYDLSKPLSNDSFFLTAVAVDGKNSSDANTYGLGSHQQGEEYVLQSKGAFKITSISNTTIKGTFEMTLYNSYDPDVAKELTVTKGSFDLPIVELDEGELADLGLK